MQSYGKIISITDHKVTIELNGDADMNKVERYASGLVLLEQSDGRIRSVDQVSKAHALLHDIDDAENGEGLEPTKYEMKKLYCEYAECDWFSLHDCSMSRAKGFIEYLIDFCFKENISFATSTWDSISDSYGFQMKCLEHRECVICSKHADYCHVETVGMGMDRKKIDHSGHHFMSLCRKHHSEQHTIGINNFINKYHIKPLKLTREQCVKLGIMTYKRYSYFKERDKELKLRGYVNNEKQN